MRARGPGFVVALPLLRLRVDFLRRAGFLRPAALDLVVFFLRFDFFVAMKKV
jgi:hypothetical protein